MAYLQVITDSIISAKGHSTGSVISKTTHFHQSHTPQLFPSSPDSPYHQYCGHTVQVLWEPVPYQRSLSLVWLMVVKFMAIAIYSTVDSPSHSPLLLPSFDFYLAMHLTACEGDTMTIPLL